MLELTLAKSLPNSHRIVHSAGGEAGAGGAARRGALPEVHLLQVPSVGTLHWAFYVRVSALGLTPFVSIGG